MTSPIFHQKPVEFTSIIDHLTRDFYLTQNGKPVILVYFYDKDSEHKLSLIVFDTKLSKIEEFIILKEKQNWLENLDDLKLIKDCKLFPNYLWNGYLYYGEELEPVYIYKNYCFYELGGRIKAGELTTDCYQNIQDLPISDKFEKEIIKQIFLKNSKPLPYFVCQIINNWRQI
jgi:hypothetical protein